MDYEEFHPDEPRWPWGDNPEFEHEDSESEFDPDERSAEFAEEYDESYQG